MTTALQAAEQILTTDLADVALAIERRRVQYATCDVPEDIREGFVEYRAYARDMVRLHSQAARLLDQAVDLLS